MLLFIGASSYRRIRHTSEAQLCCHSYQVQSSDRLDYWPCRSTMQIFDVLVTGSAGHLGHALMLELPSLGYKPLGIDILPSPTTTFVGSFADRSFVSHILGKNRGIKYVIHAGGLHKPHIVSHTDEDFIQTNVTGTLILVDEVSKRKQISFVLVSTTSAFGSVLSPKKGEHAVWVDGKWIFSCSLKYNYLHKSFREPRTPTKKYLWCIQDCCRGCMLSLP